MGVFPTLANPAPTRYPQPIMEIALIGLRSSGKTTLFNLLTGGAQTRPDGLGRVLKGISKIPDPRLNALANLFNPTKTTPAEITFWDLPPPPPSDQAFGYFQGPALNALQGADAFIHVVRAFQNPTVPDAAGLPTPERDATSMSDELILADLAILERRSRRAADNMKGARGRERDLLIRESALLKRVSDEMEEGQPLASQTLTDEETGILANYNLLGHKPMMTAYNLDEDALSETGTSNGAVSLCAGLEWELAQLPPDDEREFRESMGAQDSGKDLLLAQTLALLNRLTFFTHVSDEVRAWAVPAGSDAATAAGAIHSDMERGFIRAEVVSFDNMMACGSIAEARRRGLLRSEGRRYQVHDGDVITFLFNT